MTEKPFKASQTPMFKQGDYCDMPERSVSHFCTSKDPGIVVDVEIQPGDPVDSQFIRNFMGEFEAYFKNKSA